MLLWVCFAVLTAVVVAALARPMLRRASTQADASEAELAVYRDQLREIDADLDRGLVGEAEAQAARTELARRLIKEAESRPSESEGADPALAVAGRWTASMVALALPLAAVALYLALGAPTLPSRPFGERVALPAEKATMADLVAKVEARLREKPEDGEGWDVIAPVYMRQQRYGDAADAFVRAIRLLGESPKRLAGLGEALIMANDGLVGEQARRTYERLLALDPKRLEAHFWLAVAKEQDGDVQGAIGDLTTLLEQAPPDAAWKGFVEERLAELKGVPAGRTKGTTGDEAPAADVAAVEKMTAEERAAFIGRMVDGLAERLKQNGKDLDGWVKLVRSLHVLSRRDEAVAALANARQQFADDPKALGTLDALAESLGLRS